jgi:hypothetical protein
MTVPRFLGVFVVLAAVGVAHAEPPVASYIFPAGGQRGQTVKVRVGGLFLPKGTGWEILGPGVEVGKDLAPMERLWFEGPLVPMPESQQAEDYPRDLAGSVRINGDAPLGPRPWRLWTAQGATPSLKFMVGNLPEIVESETEAPGPVQVRLPVTINGRIFPRENVDVWAFDAKRGQPITCEVWAARLGSPLDSRIEIRGPKGDRIAENDDTFGADSFVRFTPREDGRYEVRICDTQFRGGPAYVYRLTITDGPYVEHVYPLGGRRGTSVAFSLAGQAVPVKPVTIALPADAPRDFAHQLTIDGRPTNTFMIDVDDFPEFTRETVKEPTAAPAVFNGRIDKPSGDSWAIVCKKDTPLEIELRAQRLGSPLCGVLAIKNADGKELARADAGDGDPFIRFDPPANGTYTVEITERFRARGGHDFAYRLRVVPAPADFRLLLPTDGFSLPRGNVAKFRIQAERRGGFKDAISLEFESLPVGVTATGTIPANQTTAEIVFKADAMAAIGPARVTIRGTGKIDGAMVSHTASLAVGNGMSPVETVLIGVALPTPFKVVGKYEMRWAPRGTVQVRHYTIERNDFNGPLEVSIADRQARHLQGATGPTITVPADAKEFDYPIHLPPWMETGRTCRVCVMAVGMVKDADGHEYPVSYSSVQQNEQFIAVMGPELLGLDLEKNSLSVAPGQSMKVSATVSRGKDLTGPVKLELVVPSHVSGVKAAPVEVAADQDRGLLSVAFAEGARLPAKATVLVRATAMDKDGRPVVAESKLDLVPGR